MWFKESLYTENDINDKINHVFMFTVKLNYLTFNYDIEYDEHYKKLLLRKYIHNVYNFSHSKYIENNNFKVPIERHLISFDKLLSDEISNILTSIYKNNIEPINIEIVKWLNIKVTNNVCTGKCDTYLTEINVKRINNLMGKLLLIKNKILIKITRTPGHFNNHILNNLTHYSLLLQINIYIHNLKRIKNILLNSFTKIKCKPLNCYEILEINNIFKVDNYIDTYKFTKSELFFEIIFGNIIRPEQWKKYNDIIENYKKNDEFEIHQFMMGKGKSSTITPLLYIYFQLYTDHNINIIVPEHLINDTKITYNELNKYFNKVPIILTDNQLKHNLLNKYVKKDMCDPPFRNSKTVSECSGALLVNSERNCCDKCDAFIKVREDSKTVFESPETHITELNNSILLIDEFDSMYNPLQSNYNIITESSPIDVKLIEEIFKLTIDYLENRKLTNINQYTLESEVYNILQDKNHIKNVTYGMSHINKRERFVIPYSRQNSPVEGSKFSSNCLTIILTILYFYENNKFKLEKQDIANIITINDKNILKHLYEVYNIDSFNFNVNNIKNPVTGIENKYMLDYINLIFNKYQISTAIRNISFIDVLYAQYKWQIGYSGTVNIDMNIPQGNTFMQYNNNIIKDPDEEIEVRNALLDTKRIYRFKLHNDIIQFMAKNDIDVLIDSCAYFKNYNSKEVAKMIYEKSGKPVIYMTSDDKKYILSDINTPYLKKIYDSKTIKYYYDQRHIVGTDIIQPSILSGIVIIDDISRYTIISQAIYRMRKLNKGQNIIICYVGKESYTKSTEIYNMLISNENKYNNNLTCLLYYQHLKIFARRITNIYDETNINTLYDDYTKQINENKEPNYMCESYDKTIINNMIVNKINANVFNNMQINKDDRYYNIICELLKYIINHQNKLQVLYNTNTNETVSEKTTEKVTQTVSEIQKTYMNEICNYKIIITPFIVIGYYYRFILTYLRLDNDIELLFSFGLTSVHRNMGTLVLIELDYYTFMLEHSSNINYYVMNYNIYNMMGDCINNNVKPLNYEVMFNYIINKKLNLGLLFNLSHIKMKEYTYKEDDVNFKFLNYLFILLMNYSIIPNVIIDIQMLDDVKKNIDKILDFNMDNYNKYLTDTYNSSKYHIYDINYPGDIGIVYEMPNNSVTIYI